MLQRTMPPQIASAMQRKLEQAGANVGKRRSTSVLSVPFGARFFAIGANENLMLSTAWRRSFLMIQNTGINPIFLDFDKPATSQSMQIFGGQQFAPTFVVPCNSLNIFATADITGVIVEG